jgi:putative transposase
VGRKHVSALMRRMGIEALYRKPNTSKRHPQHLIYPYLLRGVAIERANHAWAMDITYIPMARGFVYLGAIIDWHSRKVLAWDVSISMEADFLRARARCGARAPRQARDLQHRSGQPAWVQGVVATPIG